MTWNKAYFAIKFIIFFREIIKYKIIILLTLSHSRLVCVALRETILSKISVIIDEMHSLFERAPRTARCISH